MNSLPETAKEEYLCAHLEKHYGVSIVTLERLDKGAFKITLDDNHCWIARASRF